jgi:hypothetical protein
METTHSFLLDGWLIPTDQNQIANNNRWSSVANA